VAKFVLYQLGKYRIFICFGAGLSFKDLFQILTSFVPALKNLEFKTNKEISKV
jgi:hypothetical protein